MLEKVLDVQKTSMFLNDTSEDIDAYFQYISSKKTSIFVFEVVTPTPYVVTKLKTTNIWKSEREKFSLTLGLNLRLQFGIWVCNDHEIHINTKYGN